tara:strand:+ start:354 stop:680 length:327 start_codon:yes stop_codon:yes gene_type:complete
LKNFVSRNLVESERREQLDEGSIEIVDYKNVVIDMICRLKQLVQQFTEYHTSSLHGFLTEPSREAVITQVRIRTKRFNLLTVYRRNQQYFNIISHFYQYRNYSFSLGV